MSRRELRPNLQDIVPERMLKRPIDRRGYSVPWFVGKVNGKWDFRYADAEKWHRAIAERRCWVCGQSLGRTYTFVLGPMSLITHFTSEPPCHKACAVYAVRACPFLAHPRAQYRTSNPAPEGVAPDGLQLHNPGVSVLWGARGYSIEATANNDWLIGLHDPLTLSFWREGRQATRAEVLAGIRLGMDALRADVSGSLEKRAGLRRNVADAMARLPGEPEPDERPVLTEEDWRP